MFGEIPMIKLPMFFTGQQGIPGSETPLGLRTHPTGIVFYVDPNHGAASDSNDGTNPDAPLATIQAALDRCVNYRGDVVLVSLNDAWQFSTKLQTGFVESAVCTVGGVRIVGVSKSPVGVPWAAGATGEFALTVEGCDVIVEGFAFTSTGVGSDGIMIEWDGLTKFGDNVTVRNCHFETLDVGIQLEYSWNTKIESCTFNDCTLGIYNDPLGSGMKFVVVRDCSFGDCSATVQAIAGGVAEECQIIQNRFFSSAAIGVGAAANAFVDTGSGSNNLVAWNVMTCAMPAPANGDYNDVNSGDATDAWIQNYCTNGVAVTTPT